MSSLATGLRRTKAAPSREHARGRPTPRAGTRIAGLTVSNSDVKLSQEQVLERLGLAGDEFAERIFGRCGVEQRHLELGDEFLANTLQGRTQQIEDELLAHSLRAIDALGIEPRELDTLFTASLYSLGCPSLAHRLVEHYGMDPATDKYHLTGVGCASGVPLMRLASQAIAGGGEHARALVVAAESMSGLLTASSPQDPRAKIVGSAIFGDGCAAALLSNDPGAEGPVIMASQVHQIGDTQGAVTLAFGESESYLHLARELPDLAGAGMLEVVERFLARQHLTRSNIDHWIVHPGGRRIIESVQEALELSDEDVRTSWDALADHGNIGTPSIFYVLKDTLERRSPAPGDCGLMVTIGPGVTVGLMLLGW